MLKIGDFSKLSWISIRMLRHYDEIGLLKPAEIDNFTSYRYYRAEQLPIANRINALKNMGFGLAAISEIISQYHDTDQLKNYLRIKLAETKEQTEQLHNRLNLLETTILRLEKDEIIMKYDVILKEIPRRYVASVREIIPRYEMEGMLWEKMMRETANVTFASPAYPLAIFHDEGHKENEDVDVEIQESVIGEYKDTVNVKFKTVEPIQIVSSTFKGGFEQIAEINECVANWVTDNNYDFNGAMFNIYHVSPAQDPNPENWVTEVCYPVRK
ncbi:MAG: MerR family transcriptional regulator [Oscillospiraceae bacterium]|nr:MerR family transcriptional regulator [Oscillospiraceae bacterium]